MGQAICAANASELAAKGNKIRWEAYRARKLALQIALDNPPVEPPSESERELIAETDARKRETLSQIDLLDSDFKLADAEMRIKIASAKARLWQLVFPNPGSLKPKQEKPKRADTSPEPE